MKFITQKEGKVEVSACFDYPKIGLVWIQNNNNNDNDCVAGIRDIVLARDCSYNEAVAILQQKINLIERLNSEKNIH